MTYSLSQRSMSNLRGVHPNLVKVVATAISLTTQDFGVAAPAVRTAEEQHKLYMQGRDGRGGLKVTSKDGYNSKSNHQASADGIGRAVDLTPYVAGAGFNVDSVKLQLLIAVAMSAAAKRLDIGVIWGANWYEDMRTYGSTLADIQVAPLRYNLKHAGVDFNDWPHFQLL